MKYLPFIREVSEERGSENHFWPRFISLTLIHYSERVIKSMTVKDKYKKKQQTVQKEVYSQWTKIFMILPVWQKYSTSPKSEFHGAFDVILDDNL